MLPCDGVSRQVNAAFAFFDSLIVLTELATIISDARE